MKKSIATVILLALCLLLFSCKAETERFFDYQDNVRSASGKYTADDREYEIEIYFAKDDKGGVYCRRIEYTAPESIKGLTFTLEGKNITASIEGVRIDNSYFEKDSVFRPARLFALSEEDICDIKTEKDGNNTVSGKNESASWQVQTDEKGTPKKITYESGGVKEIFAIEEICIGEWQTDIPTDDEQ